jgi:hypothetical protein
MLVSNTMVIYHGILTFEKVCTAIHYHGIFYNTGQKYHGILTLEKGGTMVNYRGIFITLVPGESGNKKPYNYYSQKYLEFPTKLGM